MPSDDAGAAITRFRVLLTAAEAYPALERCFLEAERSISAGFRLFDPATRLRSAEAREIGVDWFDLVVHTLRRGLYLRLVISDFDPIGAVDLHRSCWSAHRRLIAAGELAGAGRLEVISAMHHAEAGLGPRLAFAPVAFGRLRGVVRRVNALPPARRAHFAKTAPGLALITRVQGGRLVHRARLPRLFPATHHQKMAVFDEHRLYIGGLDLNERRYDTPRHRRPPDATWHDVQVIAEGPVVRAAQTHLDGFLACVAGTEPPAPPAAGFLRTLSRRPRNAPFRLAPEPLIAEIEQAHLAGVAAANRLIYLETQFFRHLPLARALARRARACPDLRLILVLPAAPEDVAFDDSAGTDSRFGAFLQTRCLDRLRRAFGPRILVLSPVQPRPGDSEGRDSLRAAPLVYVHSKVSIFDDCRAIVSSANLNGRSLRWDTEAGLEFRAAGHVAELRRRVMGHWLPPDAAPADLDPATAFDRWKALADRNSRLPPRDRRGFLVLHDLDPARDLGRPVPGLPDEMV
ncbi:phospholipase D family protein [Rhodovulum marinum]|uniref:Phospholipase D1/2 n=1 Tax=Rhodovulum marinum TaxID=320662 RepID=A0A4R2Q3D6_9RHOB|nr:phospholipase D-like domain-containing protein [Rhodovulum marinum]TCP43070.1 phospholipase D1/2 [Rhodovulum marinum]